MQIPQIWSLIWRPEVPEQGAGRIGYWWDGHLETQRVRNPVSLFFCKDIRHIGLASHTYDLI